MDLRADIEIARPAPEVFAYISNFENNPSWQRGMESARFITSPPLAVGSRYEQVASFRGRPVNTTFEVTAFEPGRSITIESVESTFPIKVTRRVEALDASRCRVTADIDGRPGGMMRILGPIVRRFAQLAVTADYDRLKELLEQRA